jgi:hypothetical protein
MLASVYLFESQNLFGKRQMIGKFQVKPCASARTSAGHDPAKSFN